MQDHKKEGLSHQDQTFAGSRFLLLQKSVALPSIIMDMDFLVTCYNKKTIVSLLALYFYTTVMLAHLFSKQQCFTCGFNRPIDLQISSVLKKKKSSALELLIVFLISRSASSNLLDP